MKRKNYCILASRMGALKLTYYPEDTNSSNLRVAYKSECNNQRNPKTKNGEKLRFDYFVGGMLMPGRSFNSNSYRFGFNGKEKDDEITNVTGANLNFGAREFDSRIIRWWAIDKDANKGPGFSPYSFAMNNPILMKDPDGNWPRAGHVDILNAAFW